MLYADVVDGVGRKRTFVWHVGESLPCLEDDVCTKIQADGDELNLIIAKFESLPKYKGNVVIWSGPFAQFIWENLFTS